MTELEPSILHVLPHDGGGGETYVDMLNTIRGYALRRCYLTRRRPFRPRDAQARISELSSVVRSYDVIHVHGEVAAALLLPLLAAKRSVVTLHGLHLLRRVSGVRRQLAGLNLRAVLQTSSRTICVSNAERDYLKSAAGSGAMRRVVVIRNGVHLGDEASKTDRRAVRRELGLSASDPVGIWVGSLDERRDPVSVVLAAERTSTPLLVVGDGPLRADVEGVAGPHVRVLGQRADISRLLGAADFFVLLSQREGLSFGLLEAMAHGLPSLVTDIPENVEAVGDSGLTVPYASQGLVDAMMRRLAHDQELRGVLGKLARLRIAEHFSADAMISRTRAVYDEVMGSRSDRNRHTYPGRRKTNKPQP